jgi:non-lysosomal glucosylceramidase
MAPRLSIVTALAVATAAAASAPDALTAALATLIFPGETGVVNATDV